MKKMTMGLLLCWLALQGIAAEQLNWMTDLPKAQARAKAENKLVFMDFMGSDWCVSCKQLDDEVLSTPEFAQYAAKNLVLVQVDFPSHKKLSAKLKRANEALSDKYDIQGYPTVIVLNGEGKKVGELGYQKGGPAPFIEALEKMKK
ncbi:MAG TPA: thioredoxin family protein [Verrucomicrobiae bacterium]|nr:thioredoxin family protein [Verrucomicrobiae bacterium]